MYAGTWSGGGRPYSLGEGLLDKQFSETYGFGPYLGDYRNPRPAGLGDLLDTIKNVASKVSTIAGQVQGVRDGDTKIATIPADYPSFVVPGPSGTPVGFAIPWWGVAAAGVGLFMLARGTKRRR